MSPAAALVVIDMQVNMFDPANPVAGGDTLRARLRELVARARAAGVPVIFVRNCGGPGDPDQRGTPGWELHPDFAPRPDELVLDKTTCDTFASTPLGGQLDAQGVRHVVIAGLQSDFCVRETTLGAHARGLRVTLVADGHSTFDGGGRTAAETSAAVNAELSPIAALVDSAALHFA